jgi:hypothetical protein
MTDAVARRPMLERMKRAALLDVHTYEEVEADRGATGQAAAVVAIVAISRGIGAAGLGLPGILGAAVAALLGWLLWSGVTYLIGDKLLGGMATWASCSGRSDSRRHRACSALWRSCQSWAASCGSC